MITTITTLTNGKDTVVVDKDSEGEKLWRSKGFVGLDEKVIPAKKAAPKKSAKAKD